VSMLKPQRRRIAKLEPTTSANAATEPP